MRDHDRHTCETSRRLQCSSSPPAPDTPGLTTSGVARKAPGPRPGPFRGTTRCPARTRRPDGCPTPDGAGQKVACTPTTGARRARTMGRLRTPAGEPPETCLRRNTIRRRSALTAARVVAVTAAVALALPAGRASAVGQPPPEWAANAGAWPAHNYDLANTRATTQTPINSQTVSQLKVKWTLRLQGRERASAPSPRRRSA